MTVQNLYDLFARHKKDISDVSIPLFLDWADQLNRFAYRIIYSQDPEQYITSVSYTVTSGDNEYALPANFEKMDLIGCGVYVVADGVDTDQKLNKRVFGASDLGYYLNGVNLYFTPVPTSIQVYKLRYIPTLDAITALSDTMVIPDGFIDYAKNALDALYVVWDEDPSMEGVTDQRFVRAMDEFAEHIRCDSPVVGMDYYEGAFMN